MIRQFLLIGVCLLFLISASTAQHWETESITPLPEPISNNAVAAATINGESYLYTFAGIDSTKTSAGIHLRSYRYDITRDQWEALPDLPDTLGKIAASANRVKDQIYIIGGYHVFADGSEKSSDRVHRFDPLSNQFLSDGAPIPVPIDDQVQAVWRDSLIYVVSGWSENRNVFDVQIYNPSTDQWSVGTALPNGSYPAFGATGEIIGDTIYFFGGARSTGGFPISALFRKGVINPNNPTEIEWSVALVPGSEVGYRAGAAVSGNQVYWIGGSEQTYNFDGLAYSDNQGVPPANRSLRYEPQTDSWDSDRSNDLPMDLRNVAQISDSVLYLVGGMVDNQMVSRQVLRLQAADLRTSTTPTPDAKLEFTLSPNPATDQLQIRVTAQNGRGQQLRIYDALGRVVFRQKMTGSQLRIATGQWQRGIYLIELQMDEEIRTAKVVLH